MIKTEEKRYESSSGRCSIHAVIWYPDEEKYEKPVGVVQLVHGMIDHIERFTCMAEYFGCEEQDLIIKIKEFKEQGCTLFL